MFQVWPNGHSPSTCWAKEMSCHYCTRKGHIKQACLKLKTAKVKQVKVLVKKQSKEHYMSDGAHHCQGCGCHNVTNEVPQYDPAQYRTCNDYGMFKVETDSGSGTGTQNSGHDPIHVSISVNGRQIMMVCRK